MQQLGCWLALRRCVEAWCQVVECLSTLSVVCLVVALSDCIVLVSSYSGGQLPFKLVSICFSSSFAFVQYPTGVPGADPGSIRCAMLHRPGQACQRGSTSRPTRH